MYKSICYALSLLCFVGLNTNFLTAQNPKHLVPLPVSIEEGVGSFQLGPHSRLLVSPQAEETANYLAKKLRAATHYALPIIKNTQPSAQKQEGDIVLSLQPQAVLPNLEHPQEAYTMDVTTQYVEIQASATTGLFYGVQSLLQLLPPTVNSGNIPATVPAGSNGAFRCSASRITPVLATAALCSTYPVSSTAWPL